MTELERESKRFTENVGKCWHEPDNIALGVTPLKIALQRFNMTATKVVKCKHGCGLEWDNATRIGGDGSWTLEKAFRNPTYDVELIRSELGDKWEGFEKYIMNRVSDAIFPKAEVGAILNMATTPLLLLQAANAYMEEK